MANLLLHRCPSISASASPCRSKRPVSFSPVSWNLSFCSSTARTFLYRGAYVRCMANPRRVKMVARQIWREVADMLLTDKNLQHAVLPEAALGADRYLSSITTISHVEISSDLQVAKVYVDVFGDDRGREVALAGLKSKAKYVRGQLGRRMKLRLTPEVRFIEDESIERASRVIEILDKIKGENEMKSGKTEDDEEETLDLPSDDDNWDVDDETDEDVIHVK